MDRSDPRSMWHRPTCLTLRQSSTCLLAVLGIAASILVCALVVQFVLYALVPFICKTSIQLGLDDSTHVLQNITLELESAVEPAFRGLVQFEQSLLVVLWLLMWLLVLCLALLRRWNDAAGTLFCLLAVPLMPVIVIVCCVLPFSVVLGFPAVSFEFIKLFMHLFDVKPRGSALPDPYTGMGVLIAVLKDSSAGFYRQLGALCSLLGLIGGITTIISVILLYPIYGCVCVVKRDIEDTARDIV